MDDGRKNSDLIAPVIVGVKPISRLFSKQFRSSNGLVIESDESGARWDESGARWDESGARWVAGGHAVKASA